MTTIASVSSTAPITFTPTAPTTAPAAAPTASDGDSAQVSKMGDMMKKLADLEQSDPAKAKAALAKIATALKAKADATGDTKLAAIADKFDKASQTGDLSALKPAGGGHHAHGAHHAHHAKSGGDGDGDADDKGTSAATSAPATPASGTAAKVASYASHGADHRGDVESAIADALASA